MKHRLFLAAAAALVIFPQHAFASGYLIPGTSHYSASSYDEWDAGDIVHVPGMVDNSYYCRASIFTMGDNVVFESSITGPNSTEPTLVFRGLADGGYTSFEKGSFAFIALASGTNIVSVSTNSSGTGTSDSARALLECFNTTLFGNFNTVTIANPVNYLEISNVSNVSVNALVVIKGYNGTEISRQTVTLAAGTRQDIGIHDISGASNTFGSVSVAHTGTIGSIRANVSKYTFNGGVLAITATEPLHERVQN